MPIVPLLVAVLFSSAQTAERPPVAVQTVRVGAAADLKFALDEVIALLAQRQPNLRVQVTYGSSGSMHAQLRQRAPYDVYLSADIDYPRDLVSRGIGSTSDLFPYAVGRLVVWVPAGSKLVVERDGLRALEGAGRVAIANPRHAPYGRAAEAALRQAGIWDRVRRRLVLGDNVAQTAQFVQSGAADAGIIAKSLTVAPQLRTGGRYWEVPENMHPPLVQGGLILPWAASRMGAIRLREFLLSEEGRRILIAYGFGPPR
ncbi:MAG TPA: molybdate ABC transporter substrate-binding protein [Vicinamibacterales bacterium]